MEIDIKYNQYQNYLKQSGPCQIEIIEGSSAPLKYIKTGAVDMAGPDWPHMDDCPLMIGGYGENRIIGATDSNLAKEDMRTMHIGLDFFAKEGTQIFAPLAGKIHSFANNNDPRDYGPTIILEHEIDDCFSFFTLYGHLSQNSIENLYIGQEIAAGAPLALFGARDENGGWPPHLHFQIILNMLNMAGDFHGLCKPSEEEYWLKMCPNPIEFLALGVAEYE